MNQRYRHIILLMLISVTSYSKTIDIPRKDSINIATSNECSNFDSFEYAKYVKSNLKMIKQYKKAENLKETIIYLGKIDINGELLHIISSYKVIQAAILKHGHSTIYFLDSKKVIIKAYELGEPNELPYMIKNNCLYFHYKVTKKSKRKVFINKIENEIPETICVAPNDCY